MVGMVAQERAPGLARRAPRSWPTVEPNRAVADDDAQLEEFAAEPFGPPHAVLARDGRDQLPHFRAEPRTAAGGAGLPAPEQAGALPMPAHDRLGCDEGQMLEPAGAEPASEDPQQLVPDAKPSMRSALGRTGEHRELMA